ncbi:MAG: DUF1800 domain-containing protein [Planctomycetota bacterium]
MSFDRSLSPIRPEAWTPAAARHLAMRAGFGGTPAQLVAVHDYGLEAAVEGFLRPAPPVSPPDSISSDVVSPLDREDQMALRRARGEDAQQLRQQIQRRRLTQRRDDRQMFRDLQHWWVGRLLDPPASLHERMVLLWHNHFATGHRSVRDTFLMWRQHAMFREQAFDFASLAQGIVRDPAMLKYLNNDRNRRAAPNENLARELLELFMLGAGNYRESDIKEGARALTGYSVDDDDFQFRKFFHDAQKKTILGRTGDFDGDDFVDLLLRQDACARFVAHKLYDHFVFDVGDDWAKVSRDRQAVIRALGKRVKRHAYDLAPVLRELFTSRHFYDAANVGRKIKSPSQFLAGTARSVNTPPRRTATLNNAMEQMGMSLFDPPSVNGWDGGRAWINTSTLFVRQNLTTYLITGKQPGERFDVRDAEVDGPHDPRQLLSGLDASSHDDPQAVVDFLVDTLLGSHVVSERREALVAFARERHRGPSDPHALLGVLCTITAMPEYQLC